MALDPLIKDLVADLAPIKKRKPISIVLYIIAILLVSHFFVYGFMKPRTDLMVVLEEPYFLARVIFLSVLGIAAGQTVLKLARPEAELARWWRWVLAAIGAIPLFCLIVALLLPGVDFMLELVPMAGMQCIFVTLLCSAMISVVLGLWLRQGAPTRLKMAAWLSGVSGGALGALTYSWHCPYDHILYIGIWYGRLLIYRNHA
jgi:hypothetical protein